MPTDLRWPAPADRYAIRLLLLVATVILLWRPVYVAQFDLRCAASGVDPWGEPYRISRDASTGQLEVRCSGPDRREHTGDDIVHRQAAPQPR